MQTALILSVVISATAAQPPVRWAVGWPDLSKPAAGYRVLEDAEHFSVFRASAEKGVYSHHPQLAWHGGTFFAAWSNQRFGEDGPGQRVFVSLSGDGRSWGEVIECFPSRGPVRPAEETGRVLTANGWVVVEGAVYAVAEVHDNIGFTTAEGPEVHPRRTGPYRFRARQGYGRIARRVSPDGSLGPVFWLLDDPPDPLEGFEPYAPATDERFAETAAAINATLADPLHTPSWDFRVANRSLEQMRGANRVGDDGHRLCEPTTYRRPDGVLVRLFRDLAHSHRLYAATSPDGGRTWSLPTQTNVPDSPSRSWAGMLPDGRVYVVGNPIAGPPHRAAPQHYARDPLVVSVSRDGVTFGWAAALRAGAPAIRLPGKGKGRGYQYPAGCVVGGDLWVLYSVGKEDVAVSRVPIAALGK